jgi:HK97 family phage major capsid protein
VLRTELLRNTMEAIDEAALRGAGANAPAGLLNDADLQVNSAGANGLAPTWAHLVEMEHQVGLRVGDMVAPAFLTSPAICKRMRTTPRGAGLDYILADTATTVMGQPLRVSAMVPDDLTKGTSSGVCSAMLFGDFSEVSVGFWGPAAVDVLVDGFTSAATGMIPLTCRAEVAVATRDIKAFSAYTDLLAA